MDEILSRMCIAGLRLVNSENENFVLLFICTQQTYGALRLIGRLFFIDSWGPPGIDLNMLAISQTKPPLSLGIHMLCVLDNCVLLLQLLVNYEYNV